MNTFNYILITIILVSIVGTGCKPGALSTNDRNRANEGPLTGKVELVFINAFDNELMPIDHVSSYTLIKYDQQLQDKGVEIKRFAGDTSGRYKYVEIDRKEVKPGEYTDGILTLEEGIYQIKHNSVSGQPPSGFYGESAFFEVNSGEELKEIKIVLYPAI